MPKSGKTSPENVSILSADPLIVAPYGVDPLPLLANRLLERHVHELPDLSRHIVLFPQARGAARFRAALLVAAQARGIDALLPPWSGTLAAWLATHVTAPNNTLTAAARELILLQALTPFAALVDRFGQWSLIDGVFPLFDELTSNAQSLLPTDRADIRNFLATGYGVTRTSAPLEQEADWIYVLWRTWVDHLKNQGWEDPAEAHRAALTRALEALPADSRVYAAVAPNAPTVERRWLRELLKRGQLMLLAQGNGGAASAYHPDQPLAALLNDLDLAAPTVTSSDPYGHFLDAVYRADSAPLQRRAQELAHRYPDSPARDRLYLFAAPDLESEARAVELQVRRWLLGGLRNIAIVTSDRKLARRVRALLERAHIALDDSAGWAVSTTSAATALARWLDCGEQQFAHHTLLEFLKSPFITLGMAPERYTLALRRLEHDLIRRFSVGRGLHRYRSAWQRRRIADPDDDAVDELLDRLSKAAEPLQELVDDAAAHPPLVYLDRLTQSLERLGVLPRFQADPAGREVVTAIETLRTAPSGRGTSLTYRSFRNWLERELERRRFRPAVDGTLVHLLSAAESHYCCFDAIALAGCTSDYLPGASAPSPFFNEAVRRRLGLAATSDRLSQGLHDFRRLLQSAPTVLLSYRQHENREPKLPSPWLERLVAFHKAAYGPLTDAGLADLVREPATRLAQRDESLPSPVAMPAPVPATDRIPRTWTASAHQRLLDCPYMFYAADVLALLELATVPEEIDRSHYGERVHRILHAFHHGLPGLPGPWVGPLPAAKRHDAERLLHDITRAVFAAEVQERFTTRAWLYHWLEIIPAYIAWLEAHWGAGYQAAASELKIERTIYKNDTPLVALAGRIDRIDQGTTGKAILDYKTGQLPDLDSVLCGEQTQLPFYTLLVDAPVEAAMYVGLRETAIKTRCSVTGNDLDFLRKQLLSRIEIMAAMINNGASLPAWGDRQTCDRCRYEGVCRKELWVDATPKSGG